MPPRQPNDRAINNSFTLGNIQLVSRTSICTIRGPAMRRSTVADHSRIVDFRRYCWVYCWGLVSLPPKLLNQHHLRTRTSPRRYDLRESAIRTFARAHAFRAERNSAMHLRRDFALGALIALMWVSASTAQSPKVPADTTPTDVYREVQAVADVVEQIRLYMDGQPTRNRRSTSAASPRVRSFSRPTRYAKR